MTSARTRATAPNKLKSRAKAPLRNKKHQPAEHYCHTTAVYPEMLGLLARGDHVSDIAAHLQISPGLVARVACGELRIRGLEPLDMSQHPPLPCSRESDVSAALDRVDAVSRALAADDRDAADHHLGQLRELLDSYQRYWSQ